MCSLQATKTKLSETARPPIGWLGNLTPGVYWRELRGVDRIVSSIATEIKSPPEILRSKKKKLVTKKKKSIISKKRFT